MPWFPMFVQLNGADALIVGGGKVALRKAEKLLPYGPRITVAAPAGQRPQRNGDRTSARLRIPWTGWKPCALL